MNKILVSDHFITYFVDEELYIVEEKFKQQVTESKVPLASVEEDSSNVSLPNLVNHVLIIIRFHTEHDSISTYKTFLSKLLAAAGHKLNDVDFVIMNKYKEVKAKTIIENSSARYVMAFGVDIKNPENFQLWQFSDKQLIIAASLEQLPNSKPKKAKPWSLMKELFTLQ